MRGGGELRVSLLCPLGHSSSGLSFSLSPASPKPWSETCFPRIPCGLGVACDLGLITHLPWCGILIWKRVMGRSSSHIESPWGQGHCVIRWHWERATTELRVVSLARCWQGLCRVYPRPWDSRVSTGTIWWDNPVWILVACSVLQPFQVLCEKNSSLLSGLNWSGHCCLC